MLLVNENYTNIYISTYWLEPYIIYSVLWKISSKKPRKIGVSSKKVVAKAYFYEFCTVK